MRPQPSWLSLLLVALLAGCAAPSVCEPGEAPMTAETLYMGTAMGEQVLSSDDWQDFLEDTATRHFPSGLTWWMTQGQWQAPGGALVKEVTYVLQIVHGGSPEELRKTREIAAAYKARFRQESVLRVRATGCVAF